jgi:hypothetical protein
VVGHGLDFSRPPRKWRTRGRSPGSRTSRTSTPCFANDRSRRGEGRRPYSTSMQRISTPKSDSSSTRWVARWCVLNLLPSAGAERGSRGTTADISGTRSRPSRPPRATSPPVDKGNEAAKTGALQRTIQSTMEALKPEAAYFYPDEDGRRSAIMVFDMTGSWQLPATVELLFPGTGRVRASHARDERRGPPARVQGSRHVRPDSRRRRASLCQNLQARSDLPWTARA